MWGFLAYSLVSLSVSYFLAYSCPFYLISGTYIVKATYENLENVKLYRVRLLIPSFTDTYQQFITSNNAKTLVTDVLA